jgi:SAM-dependent methyltransferase
MTRIESIPCCVCGEERFHEMGRVGEWHIGECPRCTLVRVNPVPFFEPSPEFSELSRDFQYTRFQHSVTDEVVHHDAQQFRAQSAAALRLSEAVGRSRRFLDVGCGYGGTVHCAAKMGWGAVGIDIDPALVASGRERFGVDLRCGTLPDPRLEAGQFGFIRMRDVIEHLPNPLEVLVEIERLLAPGGVLLVATPNEGSLPARVRDLVGVRRTVVATVSPPHHLHGFAPSTLRRILDRAGLRPLEIRTTTPTDARYVTARNMRSAGDLPKRLVWETAKLIGMGSMLVGWAAKKDPPRA